MEKVGMIIITWLHQVAVIIWLGYIFASSVVVVPVLGAEIRGPDLGKVVGKLARRFMPWFWASIILLVITGVFTMAQTPARRDLGDYRSLWATVITAKHIIVLVMVALAIYLGYWAIPALEKVLLGSGGPPGPASAGQSPAPVSGPPPFVLAARNRVMMTSRLLLFCSLLVLLLTAIAETL